MNQSKNSQRMIHYCPFFYKDSNSIVSNHLEKKLDEKNNLSNTSEFITNSKKHTKEKSQRHLESFYKINDHNDNNDSINQRIITQLEEENQSLYQMTKLQQQRIERLEENLYHTTGGRLFF